MRSLVLLLLLASQAFASEEVFTGWISDSSCALARASAGKYTPTNPECAQHCIKEGKSVVLIDPNDKSVLSIENPATLKSHVGNKVRVYGHRTASGVLHIERVEFIEKTNPECERTPLKN